MNSASIYERRMKYMEFFRQTVNYVKQGCYPLSEDTVLSIPDDEGLIAGSVFYSHETSVRDIPPQPQPTSVEVENIDCLHAARQLQLRGYRPAVLNLANRHNPGGGVKNGAAAQEESIFRRTNIYRSLYQFAPFASAYGLQPSAQQYPMDKNFGGIYSPEVFVFRDWEKNGCALLDTPFMTSVISVAGVCNPQLASSDTMAPGPVALTKNKIRTIFRIGLLHGHDSLVLGALGCGAFHNPPNHVARLFREVMDEPEFKDKYRLLHFAILEDHNSHRAHNPEGNLKPFQTVFADRCGGGKA